MSGTALILVLASAVAHVYWNLELKRSPRALADGWWIQVLSAALCLPAALVAGRPLAVPPAGWLCVAGTGLFYAGYYTLLARAYASDDLSRAYPIARGVAPAAAALWGVLFFGERPSPLGGLGIAAVCAAVLLLAWPDLRAGGRGLTLAGVGAAIGTGLCTSAYSAIDKAGVRYVDPVVYLGLTFGAGAALQGALLRPWRGAEHRCLAGWGRLLASALACGGGYLMVLVALRGAPVSYVVPLRSVSVLLSVAAGVRVLREQRRWSRVVAAALVVAGVAAIALG